MRRLSPEALTVLGSMSIDASARTAAITTGQLDRKLYLEVNKALEAIGGVWNRKLKAHVFAEDPELALDQIVLTGGFVDARQEFGFFETPVSIADQLAKLADIRPGQVVLEPSAGKGRLVDAVLATRAAAVRIVEVQRHLADGLMAKYGGDDDRAVHCLDFLRFDAVRDFDRVVMNPPFSKQADIDHVTHAFGLLRPGGRLTAIMSAGVKFRENTKARALRELVYRHRGDFIDLPEGAFAESGTNVRAVILTMQKAA